MKNSVKYIVIGFLLALIVVSLAGCIGGADYSLLKPNAQKMIDEAELVYRDGMPCLVYLGTAGGAEDSYAFATCDWSQFKGE